jgi:2-hydroxychromene-2-carboxylate isomerase
MAPPVLNFWFEFASTYSYSAMMRITSLADAAGIAQKFRPFLLGPVFKAQGWETSPFNLYVSKGRNMWRDLERLCEELKLPFRRPEPFPQNSLQASRLFQDECLPDILSAICLCPTLLRLHASRPVHRRFSF